MISSAIFRNQAVLTGARVQLEPLGSQHYDGLRGMFDDPESSRLTGTHTTFSEEAVLDWLATRPDHHDRADWAIVRLADGLVLGEAVLNDLDVHNASVSFRIGLVGAHVFGQGYGTEATALVVDYALDVAGLHRVSLEVYDFNPRAQRVYSKCGFTVEGRHRDALLWDGQWHDAICMAVLSTDSRPGC